MALAAFAVASDAGEARLQHLVAHAWDHHPRAAEARAEAAAAWAELGAEDGFFDPRALASAGASREERGLPGVSRVSPSYANAAGVQAGLEWALLPGATLGVGLAERRLTDAPGDADTLYRRTWGARLRIPVGRDRGFRGWRAGKAAARSAYEAALGALRQVEQDLERDVALRLIDWLQAYARLDVARQAAARSEHLLGEAEALVELEVQPAHQLLPAQLELALRREELAAAAEALESGLRRLEELVGSGVAGEGEARVLLDWAARVAPPTGEPDPLDIGRVGRYRAAVADAERAVAVLRRTTDALRSDVALEVAYTWQGEGTDGWSRGRGPENERSGAAEAAIVWRRSLGARAERGQAEAAEARLDARLQRIEAVARDIQTQAQISHRAWVTAGVRLDWVRAAVRDAGLALEAEEERFRLGEGTSRQVLDAQKDLDQVARREVDIAAELLRERARYFHAVGRGGSGGREEQRDLP